MIDNIGKSCCGCSACVASCPQNCISMIKNDEGFLYPSIDFSLCVSCGVCDNVCPINQSKHFESVDLKRAYMYISNKKDVLSNSSSGGAFSELAEFVLDQGGCVFGASFSDDYKYVNHIIVESVDDLQRLRGSKYIQSEICNSYSEALKQLKKGRVVLFSGTPCQIAGFHNFLGRDYDNLILVDIVCHGVPSHVLWNKYLSYLEVKSKSKVSSVNFRLKENNFKQLKSTINNRQYYYGLNSQDPYFYLYLNNYCLRESCYNCQAKNLGYYSDITLGDFWGAKKINQDIDISNGVSLIIVHTFKGIDLVEKISDGMFCESVNYQDAAKYNPAIYSSVKRPCERDIFYKQLINSDWRYIKRKYVKTSNIKMQIKNLKERLKNILFLSNRYNITNRFSYGLFIGFKSKKRYK